MELGPRHRPNTRPATWAALVVSVLLHLPLLLLLGQLRPDARPLKQTKFDARSDLSVTVVDDDEVEKPPKDDAESLQFVSAPPPEKEETPKKAHFADQYASRADREMVHHGLPGSTAPRPPPVRPPSEKQSATQQAPPVEAESKDSDHSDDQQTDAAERQPEDEGVTAREQQSAPSRPIPPAQALFPDIGSAIPDQPKGSQGSMDYMRDVPEGDKTLLNRKRSHYWAFFDRVKTEVAKQWSPVTEYRKRDPYGDVYGVKDRYSTVHVTLNGDGSVRQLYMQRQSGLDFFDDEAIRSLRAAAPFHNPPEDLKDKDELIHFNFNFYFEINSGRFRFFRVRH